MNLSAPSDDPLRAYKAKRNFARTSEPAGSGALAVAAGSAQAFVVQKHWAGSLHYDLRLELNGTLKSWAVPKGPSFDPKVKRMAVQVEDHPLSYAAFEGTVPARQYGAGKVIVWDAGTWQPLHDAQQGYSSGNLKFELHGHKLLGKWVLVRMKGTGEKQPAWLLIKEKDSFARTSRDYSVVDEMPDSVKALGVRARSHKGAAAEAALPFQPGQLPMPPGAVPSALPLTLSPQLATLAAGPPPQAAGWLYEIKFDGYRLLVRRSDVGAQLFTRNGHDWTAKLPLLRQQLDALPPGWYDGEIVVPDEAGRPDFGALQQAFEAQRTGVVVLYLFDLPYYAGHDLRRVPLHARRALLQQVLASAAAAGTQHPHAQAIRFSEAFEATPQSVVASACKLGLEGVVAKRRDAPYRSSRSADWIKLKCSRRQEFVVGGYTAPVGARSGFGALLLGVHDADGRLQHAGNVGTGFSQQALKDIKKRLDALAQAASPFAAAPKTEGRPHWVNPVLVAEVSFGEWTHAGHIRHAVFRGLRDDKPASSIVRETVLTESIPAPAEVSKAGRASTTRPLAAAKDALATSAALKGAPRVTHPDRVVDASTGTTKIELVRYCALVADLMLKHLAGRPVSLLRAPTGVDGPLFFQKHADTEKLHGIRQLDPALDSGHPPLMEVASRQGLLAAAQWNVIEFHTMNTGTVPVAHPNRIVFDLDPGAGVAWAQVQEAAKLVHAFLAQLGLLSFLKTSGGNGLHVVVPLRPLFDADTVKGFSQAVVAHMAQTIPQRFVARSGPKNRVGKIFIDYLRNGPGATTVCAWSARARPGLGISVPVAWEELAALRGGNHWSVKSAHQRLDTGNAPWAGYARAARGLKPAMAALGYTPPAAAKTVQKRS